MTLIVAPRALRDLADIEDFTARRWGDDQAVRYMSQLRSVMGWVTADHAIGRAVGRGGLRTFPAGRHVIAYRVLASDNAVEIVRVLHQKMDIAARLAAERER